MGRTRAAGGAVLPARISVKMFFLFAPVTRKARLRLLLRAG